MGLIASLPEIDKHPNSVFVMHEKSEKLIPLHSHTKGQLSYVEGGLAYITIEQHTYVVPARHFFWIPKGVKHVLRLAYAATVLRSLYFYAGDDQRSEFYSRLGIYPAPELLIQMMAYTEKWDGKHVTRMQEDFDFLVVIKRLLPDIDSQPLFISVPFSDDERMQKITRYIESNIQKQITLHHLSEKFGMSARSMSRFFQATLNMSFLQYLISLRMVKALELILKTNKSIGEISDLVGYGNIASFSNAFYKHTNAWPSDLRKI